MFVFPNPENRVYLGEFSSCHAAVRKAREYYQQVNGCRERNTGGLFTGKSGECPKQQAVNAMFRLVCQKAGVKNFRFHDLRHEFGSRLADCGYSPYDIARLMGHADVKMSLAYVHPHASNLKRAVAEIDSRTFGHSVDTRKGKCGVAPAPKELKQQTM